VAGYEVYLRIGRVFVVQTPQPVVIVNLAVNSRRRFAHSRSRELPVVPGVERSGVQDQVRHFRVARPIIAFGLEILRLASVRQRPHAKINHVSRFLYFLFRYTSLRVSCFPFDLLESQSNLPVRLRSSENEKRTRPY
jgi:hypothetical protein